MLSLKLYYLRLFLVVAANTKKQKRFLNLLESLADLVAYYRVDWILWGKGSVQHLPTIVAVFDRHKVWYEVIVNNLHATFNGVYYSQPNQYAVYCDLQALKTNWVFKTRSGSAGNPKAWTSQIYRYNRTV